MCSETSLKELWSEIRIIFGLFSATGVECYCDGHCPDNKPNGTCVGQPGSQCFSAVEEVYNSETARFELERTFGCLPPDESGFMQVCLCF